MKKLILLLCLLSTAVMANEKVVEHLRSRTFYQLECEVGKDSLDIGFFNEQPVKAIPYLTSINGSPEEYAIITETSNSIKIEYKEEGFFKRAKKFKLLKRDLIHGDFIIGQTSKGKEVRCLLTNESFADEIGRALATLNWFIHAGPNFRTDKACKILVPLCEREEFSELSIYDQENALFHLENKCKQNKKHDFE